MTPLPDYHVHTFRCGHAGGATQEFIEAAIERGLLEIGITDHIPLYFLPLAERDPHLAMREDQFGQYVEEVRSLQRFFSDVLPVRLGLEADYAEGFEESLAGWLAKADWDLVLGSVHFVSGGWIDAPGSPHRFEREGTENLYREYYRLLARAAASRAFDVLSHFDLPKKFGARPSAPLEREEDVAIEAALLAGCAVEISSAGLRKPVGEIYPEGRLLRKIIAAGVPITFSSDAHAPAEVGFGFDKTFAHALDCGARQFVTFEKRRKIAHKLD
jgi:histidinol-phosphatase (PHP family)